MKKKSYYQNISKVKSKVKDYHNPIMKMKIKKKQKRMFNI